MNSQLFGITSALQRRDRAGSLPGAWRWMQLALAAGDSFSLTFGFYMAYALRFWTGWELFHVGDVRPEFYASLTAITVPCWLGLFALYGLYNPRNLCGGMQEYARLFNACALGLIMVMIVTFLLPNLVIARAWLLLAWGCTLALMSIWRFTARRIVYQLRRAGQLRQRVIILGANGEGRAVAEQLRAATSAGMDVIGFIDDHLPIGAQVLQGVPLLGPTTAFQSLVEQLRADTVIIADTQLVRERLATVYGAIDALRRLDVCLAPGLFELLTIGVQVREQGSVPLLALNKSRITGPHAVGKALIDRVGALLGLLLLSPLLCAIALLIRLQDGGPVLYRRRVVGVGNQPFDAFKFRSMYLDGERLLSDAQREELRTTGKLKVDPRITPVGRLLRRTSLDELPQLINVLLGQMSLVGPRMLTQEELRHFGRWQHNLLTVRPGLTGLWQISGRSNLGYEERVRLDMHYIRNYSIWLDLYIIGRTLPTIISGRGAY